MKLEKGVEVSSTVEVNGKKSLQVVAKIDIPVYESLAEIQQSFSDEQIVDIFNTQNATNMKNAARKPFNSKPGKSFFRDQAMDALADDADLFMSFKGDKPRRDAWLDAKAAELEKTWEQQKAERIAAAAADPSVA